MKKTKSVYVAIPLGVLLLGSTAANSDSQLLDLTGVLTKVTAPAVLPAPYMEQPWAAGQEISGVCRINLSGVVPVDEGDGRFNYGTASDYVLNIAGVEIGPLSAHHATDLYIINGANGGADMLQIHDRVPIETMGPSNHIGYFEDLDIRLYDPTGTAFTSPGKPVDLSKFVVGTFNAEGHGTPFSGVELKGSIGTQAISVPEPDTVPLLLTGILGLGLAWWRKPSFGAGRLGCPLPLSESLPKRID